MFASFSRSWQLVKMSWAILSHDRKLLLYPVLSLVGAVVVSAIFVVPLLAISNAAGGITTLSAQGQNSYTTTDKIISIVVLFLYYMAMAIVSTYAMTALTGAVFKNMAGGTATLSDGFQVANSRFGKILGYAAITATVGVILALIRGVARGQGSNIAGQVVARLTAGLLQAGWNIVTFLAVPVLVMENVGPLDMIKRSGQLLQGTWGRQITGNFSIGGIFFLVILAALAVIGVPTFLIVSATGSMVALIVGIALLAFIIVGVGLIQGAISAIFRVALYRYAHDQQVVYFSPELLNSAFRPAKA